MSRCRMARCLLAVAVIFLPGCVVFCSKEPLGPGLNPGRVVRDPCGRECVAVTADDVFDAIERSK